MWLTFRAPCPKHHKRTGTVPVWVLNRAMEHPQVAAKLQGLAGLDYYLMAKVKQQKPLLILFLGTLRGVQRAN